MNIVAALSLALAAQDFGCVQPVRTLAQLDSAAVETARLLEERPGSRDLRCRAAALRMQAGDYEEADSLLGQLLAEEPDHLDALLTRATLRRRQYRFADAARTLARAAALAPGSPRVPLLQGRLALDRMDLATADTVFGQALRIDPSSAQARLGLAEVAFWTNRHEDARELLDQTLTRDPSVAPAHLLAARIHREAQATAEWRAAVHRAVEVDSLSSAAHAALASVLRNDGALEEAYRHAQLAIDLDPFAQGAHSYLGNGGSLVGYDSVPADPGEFDGRVGELLAVGDAHLLARRYRDAMDPFREVLATDPGNTVALMGIGTAHYHLGDYETALDWFERILADHPGYGLAHYGVSYALRRMRDRVIVGLDEMRTVFERRDAPEPPGLRQVFPDYERLDEELRRIVRLSVEPFSNYLPALAVAGATFHLLPFHKLLWQSPDKEHTKGTRTFDLRLWDDVKGQGGFHAVGGEEWVRDVRYQRWNVVTHEFTHQVHGMFPEGLREEVARLFQIAKVERRTLDYYADFNEMEYFAQAAEAFISEVKFTDQRGTSKHTRDHLRVKDPVLYAFLDQVNERDNYRGVEIRAYRQKGNTLIRAGDLTGAAQAARQGLGRYGDHPDLLDLLARAHRLQGNYAEARSLHGMSIDAFPDAIMGYTGLAEDVVLAQRDHRRAASLLRAAAEHRPASAELQLRLADVHYQDGQLDSMDVALDSALTIEESPNPYGGIADPWILRARGRMLMEDHEGAEQALRHSLENINRRSPSAWAELALAQLRMGNTAPGREDLATARLLDPDHPRVLEVESDFAAHDGDSATARRLLERVLDEDGSRLRAIVKLSELLAVSDAGRSRALAQQGLEQITEPHPVEYAFRDGRYVPRGAFDEPTASRVHTRAGMLAEDDGDLAGALGHHQRAVARFRFNFASGVALVRLHAQAGRLADARHELRRLEAAGAPERYLDEARALLGGTARRYPCG